MIFKDQYNIYKELYDSIPIDLQEGMNMEGIEMRMWMTNTKWMCTQHLVGEHRELHAIIGILLKGTNISGYIDNNLIEVTSIVERHEIVVHEMLVRGFKHLSPMNQGQIVLEHLPDDHINYKIDRAPSGADLYSRCPTCAWRCWLYHIHGYDWLDAYFKDNSLVFNNKSGIYGLRYKGE